MHDTDNENDDPALDAKLLAIAIAAAEADLRRWLDELERLDADAASGDRTAVAKLRNPWGTSEAPGRAIPALKSRIASESQRAISLRAEYLSVSISCRHAKEMLNSYEESKASKSVDPGMLNVLADIMVKADVSERELERASRRTVDMVGDILIDGKGKAGKSSATILNDLKRLGVEGLLCLHTVSPIDPLVQIAGGTEPGAFTSRQPAKLKMHEPKSLEVDPVRPPRTYPRWASKPMLPAMWDGLGESILFSVYARMAEPEEITCRPADWEHLPPYQSFDEMLENLPLFTQHHAAAKKSEAKMAARRLLQQDSPEWGKLVSDDPEQAALLQYCEPVPEVLHDQELWDAWLQWRVKIVTIKSYLAETLLAKSRGELVWRWLYFLAGRFAKSEDELPVCMHWMFEWLALPVVMTPKPATRFVVPNELLNAPSKADPVVVYFAERLQDRRNMILDAHEQAELQQARKIAEMPGMKLLRVRLVELNLTDELQNLSFDESVDFVALMNEYHERLDQCSADFGKALKEGLAPGGGIWSEVQANALNAPQGITKTHGSVHFDELKSRFADEVSDLETSYIQLLDAIIIIPMTQKLAKHPGAQQPDQSNEATVENDLDLAGDTQLGLTF